MPYTTHFRAKEEFIKNQDSRHGTAGLRGAESFEKWYEDIVRNSKEETVKEGLVPATTFLAFNEEDILVGMIDIRHRLNPYLEMVGGHIGYSVRKSQRQRGYATKMLELALKECEKMGIKKALITCNKGNIASSKTIIKNGGILEDELPEEGTDEIILRYFITL